MFHRLLPSRQNFTSTLLHRFSKLPSPNLLPFTKHAHRSLSIEKTKRIRKPRESLDVHSGAGLCAAYCIPTSVSLTQVSDWILSWPNGKGLKGIQVENFSVRVFARDVVHLGLVENGEGGTGHVFCFASGAAVFWGVPLGVRNEMMRGLERFQERGKHGVIASGGMLDMEEFEHEFRYTVVKGEMKSGFRGDEIFVREFGNVEELLALSYGLAQSVKLMVFEEAMDSLIMRTRSLPDELAKDGKIYMPRKEVRRLIGELMAARYSVNLVSDILDTPEWFWQHAQLERLFLECVTHVELKNRARILNTRAVVIGDALEVLNHEVGSSSSDRVERAILALIAVEVCIEVFRLMMHGGGSAIG